MDEDTTIRVAALYAALDSIDYYSLLGVPKLYDLDELRDSYYRFARDLHPDNFREAHPELKKQVYAVFKRAAEAYRVLGDPTLRVTYDEGLSRGETRLRAEETQRRSTGPAEPTFQSLGAKQLWRQALEAESAGDLKRAKLSLTLVLAQEPGHAEVQAKMEEIGRRLKDTKK